MKIIDAPQFGPMFRFNDGAKLIDVTYNRDSEVREYVLPIRKLKQERYKKSEVYKQYSFIQGGDGGMEYAMCTLILGNGTLQGIYGTPERCHIE